MEFLTEKLNPDNLRYLFYLVTPNETYFPTQSAVPNITDKTTIWMVVLVLLEFLMLDPKKYALNDTITSLNAGLLSIFFRIGGLSIAALFYEPLYNAIHLVELPKDSVYTWVLCFLTQDLAYYLAHRAVHEAGVFWSFHQMHHSSEYYNLSTALRQAAIQDIGTAVFDLMQAVAIPPNVFIVHRYLNGLYQFWLHTEIVPYLGPLEYFFNTPSSHRVHHGRNPYCIDKNYGGVMSIWDRLFGTYAAEKPDEPIAYGLVTPVDSFDQLWCQFFEFKALGYDKGQLKDSEGREMFPGFWNKVKATFWPPGYFPGVKTRNFFLWKYMNDTTEGIPDVKFPVVVYNPPLSGALKAYLLITKVVFILISLKINEERHEMSWLAYGIAMAFVLGIMQKFGYYFDRKGFATAFDVLFMSLVSFFGAWIDSLLLTYFGAASIAVALVLSATGQVSGKEYLLEKLE